MADLIAMFSRWAKSGLSVMSNMLSYSSLDGSSSSSSIEPTRRNAVDDFQRIMRMLPRIEAVLRDAEERDILDTSVNQWLSELRLLAYDIDDVVDEYEYEVLRVQIQAKSTVEAYHRGKRKRGSDDHHNEDERDERLNVFESSSSEVPSIPDGMAEKLREIRERFDEIEKDRNALRLREKDGVRRSIPTGRPRPTSSLVDEKRIIGREPDKENIIELLLSVSEPNKSVQVSNKIEVIPIVGMGGVGKTTLAQYIYNDPRICQYFDLRIWIYISEDFDLVRLTKAIYRSITSKSYEEGVEFDHLQDSIKKELMQFKRIFLVLDDVWNEERCLWESLLAPFHGAGIVTILMTTRNENVANVTRTINSFRLGFLSEEEGWRLFRQHALCDDENLLQIGKGIVRKCGGLPLAIKLLGSHLQFERDEDKWISIFESDLWELNPGVSEILPALRLSYQRMPAHLKPCFRYFSMFSKNEILEKKRLVMLWVAQGYIQAKTVNKTEEEMASEYFDELLGRSFLQEVEFLPDFFEIHDLIFDLAVFISNKEFIKITLGDDKQNKLLSDNNRHLVIYDQRTHNGAEADTLFYPFLRKHTALRSIFYNGQSITDIFQLLDPLHLRALHIDILKYDLNKSKFQVLIPLLKHLRYIYVSIDDSSFQEADLSMAFSSFHGMYNVQVLDLSACRKPLALQTNINNLINLRHLILPDDSFMPCGMSKLTSLQTLKRVIVNVGSPECGEVSEIKDLENLRGSCRIYNINFATDVGSFKKANINKKKHIWRLFLDWDIDYYDESIDVDIGFDNFNGEKKQTSELAEAMLEALRPHNDLNELVIHDYPGNSFPLWFGDPSYSLNYLVVENCHKLSMLCIFPKLQFVSIKDCSELTSIKGLQNHHFLEYLELNRCPKLQLSLDENFSKMPGNVKVIDCPGLREWCQRYGFEFKQTRNPVAVSPQQLRLEKLKDIDSIYGSANLVPLRTLYICDSYERHFPENECIPCSLNALHLSSCRMLKFIPPYHNLSALKLLKIEYCKALTYLPGLQMMKSLEKLEIMNCPKFKLSPVQRLPFKLQYLHIRNCPRLMWLPGLQQLFSLRYLILCECYELMLLPPEQLPFMHQVQLEIINCPKLANWGRRHNLSYNKKESSKELIARSSQQINSWLKEEEPVHFENICVLDYDEDNLKINNRWPAFRLLGFYVCFCVHLKSIAFSESLTMLKQLRIWNCSHLENLYGLSDLIALEDMDISNCPNLGWMFVPQLSDRRRYPSFRFLKISKCPKVYLPYSPLPKVEIEIRACPLLQEWCLDKHIEYFEDCSCLMPSPST